MDNWGNRKIGMKCASCMWFAQKAGDDRVVRVGRCRRRGPTMSGFPVMFPADWCGDHKSDEDKIPKDTAS